VSREFRHSSNGEGILRTYRLILWIGTLLAVAIALAPGVTLLRTLDAFLIQAAGFLAAFVKARHRTLAFAASPNSIVEADLTAPREPLPGGPVVALLPVASLGALGLWVSLRPNGLPARFPVHWDFHGPDSWAATTPAAIFGFLALHALTCLLLIGVAWGVLNGSRHISASGAGAAAERAFRRRTVQLLIVCAYFIVGPAWFAFLQPSAAVMTVWSLGLTAVVVAFTVSLIRTGQGGSRAIATVVGAPTGDRTPDACWKWGLFYINPADPSIFVEKRFGIGYTVNLGNHWAWLVLALLLTPLAATLAFRR
jgi:uncharacterized membrane protein